MRRRPPAAEIPDRPGAYLFRDEHGAVLYVGKAKSLRKRVSSYFTKDLPVRTRTMVEASDAVEWIVTENEVEALMVEYSLIQRHQPRFNIRFRDDKSYPYLAITVGEEWPRDLLLRTFPVRTCSNAKFRRHAAQGLPCLLFHIERCSGPCVDEVTPGAYREHVEGLSEFLTGGSDAIVARLRSEMEEAAGALEFERAARLRDQVASVEKAMARQEVATPRREDFDLVAVESDDLEAAVVVLRVRSGRVTGRIATVLDVVEDTTAAGLISRTLSQLYGGERPPPEVLVQELPEDPVLWEAWLVARREGRVSLRVPKRGAKRRLMDTAAANAREVFARHRLRRHNDHNARARALRSLQETLGLPEPPLRIECYDISTIQGTDTVGSMVVMEDGIPRGSDYKRFRVRGVAGQDDFAAMEEVLRRRLTAYLREREQPVEERGKFAYPPSLLLVDGGAGQVSRAVKVVEELGLDIPVAGLAKRMEEVYLPGLPEPVRIPRGEEALYLLQRIRDEAHRFAVSYHRTLRGRRMVDSALDAVPGVGPVRKQALVRRFGSLKRIREAEVDELSEVVPAGVAARLYAALREPEPRPGDPR